jgi:hypothetical protein
MTLMIVFALGYLVGGVSALLVVGLARAARGGSAERGPLDMVSHDAERYSL